MNLLADCPYCAGKNAAFSLPDKTKIVLGEDNSDYAIAYHLGQCGVCRQVCMFIFSSSPNQAPSIFTQWEHIANNVYRNVVPEKENARIASNIPENVEKPLREAEDSYIAKNYTAAGSCYRKAMERSLKHLNPDEEGMLFKRIKSLKESGLIPESMIELLHQVRLFGNEAMHDDDYDPEKEDISAAREFAHLFLTYAFTMPAQVQAEKDKRALAKDRE